MWRHIWVSPKKLAKDAKSAVWSGERSSLVAIYRAMQSSAQTSQAGIPEGMEEAFLRGVRRAHLFWGAALVSLALGLLVTNFLSPPGILGNLVFCALLLLSFIELVKYAFFHWHYTHRESFARFLGLAARSPGLVFFLR